jgi:hypothetical protein
MWLYVVSSEFETPCRTCGGRFSFPRFGGISRLNDLLLNQDSVPCLCTCCITRSPFHHRIHFLISQIYTHIHIISYHITTQHNTPHHIKRSDLRFPPPVSSISHPQHNITHSFPPPHYPHKMTYAHHPASKTASVGSKGFRIAVHLASLHETSDRDHHCAPTPYSCFLPNDLAHFMHK